MSAARGIGAIGSVAVGEENTAITVGPAFGITGRVSAIEAQVPTESNVGVTARAGVSVGPVGAGFALDANTTGQFTGRVGLNAGIGRFSVEGNVQLQYSPERGWEVSFPPAGRFSWSNEAFIAPTVTVVVPNEVVDQMLDQAVEAPDVSVAENDTVSIGDPAADAAAEDAADAAMSDTSVGSAAPDDSGTSIGDPAADAAAEDAADAAMSDTGVGDAGVGDSGMSDTGVGDAGVGDSGMSDSGMGDAGVGDSGMGDSGVGGDSGAGF